MNHTGSWRILNNSASTYTTVAGLETCSEAKWIHCIQGYRREAGVSVAHSNLYMIRRLPRESPENTTKAHI